MTCSALNNVTKLYYYKKCLIQNIIFSDFKRKMKFSNYSKYLIKFDILNKIYDKIK